ncbi:RNA 2',3'-cyclic phosphodiesterase [Candidatus Falkowbacteria bacterium CG_4_9_14_3_um_filter_38_19]|uniref:RNA 2',3'-cyclic phosphodiesterase n=2 Tax=Candidatus Falkowiibacteriota TaxID=1752728 RepID=A0A2M6WR95_9BACT|nr:RNA 2',3'-cyclic phosphodiesterase [Candidatus Falkowbacteria bacterium]NCS99768.1 RNA 2',3'-cyclic phosphodiesterase [Candidatus Parcubacteria bacterium]PIT95328.1 MAG: RNA 2',3'-cyclic phosphodiesterase [Candidatus Falkowbacteria bacterium CG10_big_fil_rev_8_21_14_0_10_38_22]PJB17243.1 MAG: RNA 2',3'-cyclic phosphodiesterase [Candidatus Falkowbacteria bacterium CG_4_9_14_3_um_filter_38_19]
MNSKRLFIALNLPTEAKAELVRLIDDLRTGRTGVKWCQEENLHLTLHFLGYMGDDQADQVKLLAQSLSGKFGQIQFNFGYLGGFPNLARPRVIFVEFEQIGSKSIYKLQQLLGQGLAKLNLAVDQRPWQSHITLGRVKDYSRAPVKIAKKNLNISQKHFVISTFDLMESQLKPTGAEYFKVASYNL